MKVHSFVLTLGALGALLSGATLPANARDSRDWSDVPTESVAVPGSYLYLGEGDFKSLELGGWRQVKQLVVQAEGATSRDAMFDVMVNGAVVGTIYVPGRDPSYVVTVKETTRSIEFRHVSGGPARIRQVVALQSVRSVPGIGHGSDWRGARGEAAELSRQALDAVNALEDYAKLSEYETYLLPIKKVAARAYAIASVRGDLSAEVHERLLALKAQIDFAEPYLDEAFEMDAAFDLAVELLVIKERIRHALE